MNIEKAKKFIKELNKLENKYGISIGSTYDEEIDYNYEGESYISGINSYVILRDTDGNGILLDELLYNHFSCNNCGTRTNGEDKFCSLECKNEYEGSN